MLTNSVFYFIEGVKMRSLRRSSIWSICGSFLVAVLLLTTAGHSSTIGYVFPADKEAGVQSGIEWSRSNGITVYDMGRYRTCEETTALMDAMFGSNPDYSKYYCDPWAGVGACTAYYKPYQGYHIYYVWPYYYAASMQYFPDTSYIPDKNLSAGTCSTQVPDSGPPLFGNPVNAATGNKYEPVTDFTVSIPGVPLEFKRYYNSAAAANGPLGYGWTHSYSMSAKEVPGSSTLRVKIIDADGKALYFSRVIRSNGTTLFFGESGVRDNLIINAAGQYVFRKKDNNLTYLFDTKANNGKLLSITDTNGNTLSLTYTSGLLAGVSSNFGKTITIAYNGSNISSITDPKGQSISYTYNSGNLTQVTYADTNQLKYTYDASHRLTDKKDTGNNLIGHWAYNTESRVSTYYPYLKDDIIPQEAIDFTYNLSATPNTTTLTKYTSTGTTTTTYTTEINDGVRVATGIGGCGTSCGSSNKYFTYNQWGEITDSTRISSGQEYTTRYTYDEPANFYDRTGEVLSMTEAYGLSEARTTTYTYTHRTDDPFLLTESTETKASVANPGQDKVITTAYNTQGKVSSVTETGYVLINGSPSARTYTISYEYSTYGQLTQINGPRTDVTDVTTYAYFANTSDQGNNRGQLHTITNALSQATQVSNYDANGNVGTITDPNGVVTVLTYDARNRLSTVTNQSTSASTQYFYDSHGNISYIIPPEGNRIDYAYNLADKITQISDTLGNKIEYYYGAEGNRTGENILDPTDALKKSLDYTYDEYNRIKRIVNPDATYTEYTYDSKGNRTAVRDPRANTTNFTYDAFDRLHTMTQPGAIVTTNSYDTQDNLASVTDPRSNVTQYTNDDFGRKNGTVSPDTGITTNVYDEAGNLTQSTDAKGTIINYAYDVLNRVTSVQFPADSTQNITYTYDSTQVTNGIGRLTGRTDPSGIYSFSYDAQGNLITETKIISGVTYTTQYTFNKNNILTSMTYPSGRVVTYTLDTAQRISQVSTNSQTLASSIAYRPFGPITALTYGNGLSLSQGYDDQYRLSSIVLGSVLNFGYTYDAAGNVTSITNAAAPIPASTDTTYAYPTDSNKLSGISGSDVITYTYDLNGNITAENNRVYTYDLSNQIVTVTDNNTQIAAYIYNGLRQRTKKIAGSDTTFYHYDTSGHLIAETNASGTTLVEYIYLGDRPLAMIRPTEQVYYYHTDHLGTPQVMTSSTGTVAWKAAYNAFGNASIDTSSTVTSNLRFPGQYYDAETGLHYNWNRYYDPNTGRYITTDPIGLAGGINLFGYVGGNPVNKIDPWGLVSPNKVPNWVSMPANIAVAEKGLPFFVLQMLYGTKGLWDYKYQGYEDFGNYHYGVTMAAAGYSEYDMLSLAGLFHTITGGGSGLGVPFLESPYNDSYKDQYWISQGYRDYKNYYAKYRGVSGSWESKGSSQCGK
jgi:RHS repeat-associated protein